VDILRLPKSGYVCDSEPTGPYDYLMLHAQMFGLVPGTTKHSGDDIAATDLDLKE